MYVMTAKFQVHVAKIKVAILLSTGANSKLSDSYFFVFGQRFIMVRYGMTLYDRVKIFATVPSSYVGEIL